MLFLKMKDTDRIVRVVWKDITGLDDFEGNFEDIDKSMLGRFETIGRMVKEDKDILAVATTKEISDENGDKSRDIMMFPKCIIEKIEHLEIKQKDHLGVD